MLSKASFITCSLNESENTRVDQVLEKVHPPVVLVPSLTSGSSMESNLLCNTHYTTTPKLAMDDLTLKAATATDSLTLKSYSDRFL